MLFKKIRLSNQFNVNFIIYYLQWVFWSHKWSTLSSFGCTGVLSMRQIVVFLSFCFLSSFSCFLFFSLSPLPRTGLIRFPWSNPDPVIHRGCFLWKIRARLLGFYPLAHYNLYSCVTDSEKCSSLTAHNRVLGISHFVRVEPKVALTGQNSQTMCLRVKGIST